MTSWGWAFQSSLQANTSIAGDYLLSGPCIVDQITPATQYTLAAPYTPGTPATQYTSATPYIPAIPATPDIDAIPANPIRPITS